MSARRPPAPPPELPGFTYEALLGSGGFADVFLYQQHLPERRVAVKVLLAERLAGGSADAFTAEANIMAQLSTHPAIVTIHQAGLSGDGRPYLVMEYCPKPNLQVRYRREAFSVAESLRVGVQVAAAVETAHRADILHRDIKPANILVTEYNRPALTDFGIAVAVGGTEQSAGMSIPWSPPEAFADVPRMGVETDVWGLGSTVYTLLAGRSPFERPGGRNSGADLIQRIETETLPPLGRADVPASLALVLSRAMAKDPGQRYRSAIELARALQRVQIELQMSPTPIDVLDDGPAHDDEDDEDGGLTRVRNVVSIDPSAAGAAAPSAPPVFDSAPTTPPVDETVLRPSAPATVDSTVQRAPRALVDEPSAESASTASPESAPTAPARRRSRGGLVAGLIAGVVLLGAGAATVWAVASSAGTAAPSPTADDPGGEPVDGVVPDGPVPIVSDLTATVEGDEVSFSWKNPDPQDGDAYLWGVLRAGEETKLTITDETSVIVPADASGRTCIEVFLRRGDSRSSAQPAQECAP